MDSIGDNLDSHMTHIKLAQYKEQPLLKKWAPTHNLSLLDGTHWYHGTTLVVVADNALRRGVISLFHDHITTGHAGNTKTLQLITLYYWWPNMKTFITEYIKGCATCQMTKVNTHPTHPPMFPITPADNAQPFETIAMDFITKLPQLGGFDTILIITDTDCSKASIFIPCHKTIDLEGVALLYLNHIIPHYSIPCKIISDHVLCSWALGPHFSFFSSSDMYLYDHMISTHMTAYLYNRAILLGTPLFPPFVCSPLFSLYGSL